MADENKTGSYSADSITVLEGAEFWRGPLVTSTVMQEQDLLPYPYRVGTNGCCERAS